MTLPHEHPLAAATAAGAAAPRTSIATPAHDSEHDQLRALLAAAADPVRWRILALVRAPLPVQEICARLELAQPRASHHLAVLRACGLVSVRAVGRHRYYARAPRSPRGPIADVQQLLDRWLPGAELAAGPSPAAGGAYTPPPLATEAAAATAPPGAPQPLDDFLL